jgi:opacity protein-like surface antigen
MRICVLLITAISLGCFPISQGYAQDKPYYIGGYLGYEMQKLDTQWVSDAFIKPIDADFDDSFGLQIKLGKEFKEYLFGEVMLEYVLPFEDSTNGKDAKLNVINIGINCKPVFYFLNKVDIYGLIGLGLMYAKQDISYMDQSKSEADIGLDLRLGIGTEIPITPEFSIGIESDYVFGIGATDYVRYLNLNLSVLYRF